MKPLAWLLCFALPAHKGIQPLRCGRPFVLLCQGDDRFDLAESLVGHSLFVVQPGDAFLAILQEIAALRRDGGVERIKLPEDRFVGQDLRWRTATGKCGDSQATYESEHNIITANLRNAGR